ncbi:hypothetical protein [Fodinicurvata sp. EGI_FJ10296]
MAKMITKTRTLFAVLLAVSSMAFVTACDEVDDTGGGQPPPEQPMQ